MILYILFIILSLLFSLVFDNKQEKDKFEQFAFWFLCFYLICMAGFSYGLGGDKQYYLKAFNEMNASSLREYIVDQFFELSYMPLWSILNYFIKHLFNSFYLVQFTESLVINLTVCYYVRHYTQRHFLFLFLYFIAGLYFQFNTEVMREGFAISFGLIAMHQYMNKCYWGYLFCILIAFLFHVSALILLFFPLCTSIPITKKSLLLFFAICCFIRLLSVGICAYLKMIIPSEALLDKLDTYSSMSSNIYGFILILIRYLFIPFLIGYFLINTEKDDQVKATKQHLIAFQTAIGVLICGFGWGFSRFYNYVYIIYLIWIAEFLCTHLNKLHWQVIRVIIALILLYFPTSHMLTYLPSNQARLYELFVPYTSFLDEPTYDTSYREEIYKEALIPLDER